MSTTLVSPESSAPLSDWQAWLAELQEMPKCSAVAHAMNQAQQVLRNGRKRKGDTHRHRREEIPEFYA